MIDTEQLRYKLFSSISFGGTYSPDDPDAVLINKNLKRIPSSRLGDFYAFLYDYKRGYINDKGFLGRGGFVKAVDDFVVEIEEGIWKEYGVRKQSEELYLKLSSVYDLCVKLSGSKYIEDLIRAYDNMDIERISFVTKDRGKIGFSEYDKRCIEDMGIEKLFLSIYGASKLELIEEIYARFKSYFSEQYLLGKNNSRSLGQGKQRSKREIAGLIGNAIKDIKM